MGVAGWPGWLVCLVFSGGVLGPVLVLAVSVLLGCKRKGYRRVFGTARLCACVALNFFMQRKHSAHFRCKMSLLFVSGWVGGYGYGYGLWLQAG